MINKACVSAGLHTIHLLFIHAKTHTHTSFKRKLQFISNSFLDVRDNLFLYFPTSSLALVFLRSPF